MHSFFVVPTTSGTGLTSVCLGIVRAFDQLGVRVAFYKPVAQILDGGAGLERSTHLIRETVGLQTVKPIDLSRAQQMMAQNKTDLLMEEVIQNYHRSIENADVVVIEGLVPQSNENYIARINQSMSRTLGCDIILVAAKKHYSVTQLNERIEMSASLYGGVDNPKLLGCILNKVGAPPKEYQQLRANDSHEGRGGREFSPEEIKRSLPVFDNPNFMCLGIIHWKSALIAPRTLDVARYLDAECISEGDLAERRVLSIVLSASTAPNMLHILKAGTLVITPGDRVDIFLAVSLAVLNGVPLAGLIFTGDISPDPRVMALCKQAIDTGLPVLSSGSDSLETARKLANMSTEVPEDDVARMTDVMDTVAQEIHAEWLVERGEIDQEVRLSPAAFRHLLISRARAANKIIVLPEGEEARTIQAAAICVEKKIARCVLLGNRNKIQQIAQTLNIKLPEGLQITDPDAIYTNYIHSMVELRKHKGISPEMASALLEDSVVLGTMMLALGEVDGLVSGAVHTTANTIRPALQLIKTNTEASLVSSIFFMLLPEEVLVYGDCAVNPNPSAEQLADIAIQSGDSARAFGIEPKIAMISYSTGVSGVGSDVDKVREATEIAKGKRPDLIIDGPLQYDAAAIDSVAKSKAPDSPVAGKATVFVFPDLNTGNTTYKAVQRSAKVLSIGPVLQGLKKPVNDLSRGALVDDIVFTIAMTAIQAEQSSSN